MVWKKRLGTGYSSVSVASGVAITMYSDGSLDHVVALDATDGSQRWRYTIGPAYLGHWGSQSGPLSTPLITNRSVITLSPQGELFALDIETGHRLWIVDLVESQEARSPFWGFTTSPRLIKGLVILQTGGTDGQAISAYDPGTGKLVWTAGTDAVDYQSYGIFTIGGQKHLVFQGNHSLIGIRPEIGEELWSFAHGGTESASSTSSHPVEIAEGRYFVKNRSNGGVLIQVVTQNGAFTVEEVWRTGNIGGTYIYPIYHKGLLFGYKGRILTALDAGTGDRVWRSREPGDGLPLVIDGHLVIITKQGKLSIAPAGRTGYRETTSLQVFDDIVWSPACFADGKLYVRSMSEIACVEILSEASVKESVADLRGMIPNTHFAAFVDQLSTSDDKTRLLDDFLDEHKTFPVIESDSLAHFVYLGEAREVAITGDHIGRRIDQPMHRVKGTNLFYYSSRLEPDARITYRFTVDLQHSTVDVHNSNRIRSLFFGEASWFGVPSWKEPAHLTPLSNGARGEMDLVTFASAAGDTHQVKVYLPQNYDTDAGRYAVTYVHDVRRPFSLGKIDVSLDNLIGKKVAPVIVVLVPPFAGGGYNTYVGSSKRDLYKDIFINELIPFIDGQFSTLMGREGRANYGTGRGGFMACYATFSHPDLFGGMAIQSTYWDQTSESESDTIVPKASSLPPFHIYLDWGRYDARSPIEGNDTGKATEQFAKTLTDRGYDYVGGEVNDGAGWASWRNRTDRVFETLFPYKP